MDGNISSMQILEKSFIGHHASNVIVEKTRNVTIYSIPKNSFHGVAKSVSVVECPHCGELVEP